MNYEILLIDDGSEESFRSEIRDIARLDERIKVITQSNLGVSAARNEGIKHSKGKYLTFVDADDVLVPYFFSEAVHLCEKENVDFLIGGNANDYSPIVGFFVRQGTSVNAVKYAELYKNNLDSEAHYSLYNILRWLQNSPFNSLFNLNLDFSFGNQSLSTALHGTYLADFVSYYANSYLIY